MAQERRKSPTKQFAVRVSAQNYKYLQMLAKFGAPYGASPAEIAKHFIQVGIEGAFKASLLPPPSYNGKAKPTA